jgi:leucine dehydrogenase
VHATACDIYSPCALGSALNDVTIPQLQAAAVVGAANNQLADPSSAAQLAAAEVLYAPDYVVNAGGVINLAEELAGYDRQRAWQRIEGIFDTTTAVFRKADAERITTADAADRMAEERLTRARQAPATTAAQRRPLWLASRERSEHRDGGSSRGEGFLPPSN